MQREAIGGIFHKGWPDLLYVYERSLWLLGGEQIIGYASMKAVLKVSAVVASGGRWNAKEWANLSVKQMELADSLDAY